MRLVTTLEIFSLIICLILNNSRSVEGKCSSSISKTKVKSSNIGRINSVVRQRKINSGLKLELQSYAIHTDIRYRFATTVLSRKVRNLGNVTARFRINHGVPESAFITDIFLMINGKTYRADVTRKNQKVEISKQAQWNALYIEFSDDRTSVTKFVDLEPNSSLTFNVTYEQLLERKSGVYENLIYVQADNVLERLDVIVNIEESAPLTRLETLYTDFFVFGGLERPKNVVIEESRTGTAQIRWSPTPLERESKGMHILNGQFLVRYDVERTSKYDQLLLLERGYFAHFIAPVNLRPLSKHLTLVMDCGLMSDYTLNMTQKVLESLLPEIDGDDVFSLIVFTREVLLWSKDGVKIITNSPDIPKSVTAGNNGESEFIIEATEKNIYDAIDFVNSLQLEEFTNRKDSWRIAINLIKLGKMIRPEHRPILIYLAENGPNLLENMDKDYLEREVSMREMHALNSDVKCSIFILSVGYRDHYKFFDAFSKLNGNGFAVAIDYDPPTTVIDFYKQINSLSMSDVSVKYDPKLVDLNSVTSSDFAVYFEGTELTIAGKMTTNPNRTFDVDFNANYQSLDESDDDDLNGLTIVLDDDDDDSSKRFGLLERLWAFLRMKQLLDMDLINGVNDSAFKKEAFDLTLKYSFVTSLTPTALVEVKNAVPSKV